MPNTLLVYADVEYCNQVSEKTKTSQLPVGFWRLSVLGASLILTYAIFRKDPVLLIGHGAGLIIYIRNIYIWKKQVHEVD